MEVVRWDALCNKSVDAAAVALHDALHRRNYVPPLIPYSRGLRQTRNVSSNPVVKRLDRLHLDAVIEDRSNLVPTLQVILPTLASAGPLRRSLFNWIWNMQKKSSSRHRRSSSCEAGRINTLYNDTLELLDEIVWIFLCIFNVGRLVPIFCQQ
jgi:hypothetical protein